MALAVAARFFNNMSYNTLIQWSPELLPTGLRGAGCSLVYVAAFSAVVFSPFVVYSVSVDTVAIGTDEEVSGSTVAIGTDELWWL